MSSGWWHLVGRCCFVFAGIGLWHWALLGRQAAWRPRCILNGVVWLMVSCWQMLIVFAGIGLWLRAQFRSSSCLAAGCNREMSSSLLAAQWKRLLCSVIVSTGKGAFFGCQAAWRPGSGRWVSPSSRREDVSLEDHSPRHDVSWFSRHIVSFLFCQYTVSRHIVVVPSLRPHC